MNKDNLAALLHLRTKLHKWKNIAILAVVFSLLLLLQTIFGVKLGGKVIEEDYIASIKIDQVIFEDDYRSKILKEVLDSNSIKAVIININSPGGGIVGSEILFNELREIAKVKPTVVLMGSLAASGGYMAAIASDYIVAHNGTLTGSIGVLMESPEVTELANKIGVKLNSYKSSPLKGAPSMFEKSTPAIDAVMQESIADSHKFFSDLVKERRGEKLDKANYAKIFDGRIFTGRQALEVGLVDKVGGKKDALDYLGVQKIDVEKLPIYEVEIEKTDKRFFDKFLNLLPFFSEKKFKNSQQIMAVMP
jgi:protease-4